MKKRVIPIRELFLLDINPAIRILLISDLIWWSGVGLMGPVFALFVVDFVKGGNAAVGGIARSAGISLHIDALAVVHRRIRLRHYRGRDVPVIHGDIHAAHRQE
ncbi:MAG: hypothetical protein U9Q03_03955 [Patescibacteria group bacterium]|nr:hypothetical protein [Patescibacteria group bacterium]